MGQIEQKYRANCFTIWSKNKNDLISFGYHGKVIRSWNGVTGKVTAPSLRNRLQTGLFIHAYRTATGSLICSTIPQLCLSRLILRQPKRTFDPLRISRIQPVPWCQNNKDLLQPDQK